MDQNNAVGRVAFLGNHTPRQCGIATFTADVAESVAQAFPQTNCIVVPINDRPEGYDYPPQVRFEINQEDRGAYMRAADYLHINDVEVLSVQHEFGIFGGDDGEYVLDLMREARMPIVTTLHTLLIDPSESQRRTMDEVVRLSDRVVTMTEKGQQILREVYGVPAEKIDLIPHGIPDMPFVDPHFYKDQFGVEGKTVLLTFGLLSEGKGLEHAISSLPAILEQNPEVVYIILGATHPAVLRREGEAYRDRLKTLAESLGVGDAVKFFNQFVSLDELKEFIGAADIYVTPYLNAQQITSGTLAYCFGAGKAVVSTPYWHAEELLADGRGALVEFADPASIAAAVNGLLADNTRRHAMRKRAYLLSRGMIWPETARRYMESFQRACADRARRPRETFAVQILESAAGVLPDIKLDHLFTMTDQTGIFQHAVFSVPNNHEGYCTDDNARAYTLTTLLEELGVEVTDGVRNPASAYLAFLWQAFNHSNGRFRNFMSFDRRWLDEDGTEDCHGRAVWSLGTALGRSSHDGHRQLAGRLFSQALPATLKFTSPRAWATTILAVHEYLRRFSGDSEAKAVRETLTAKLVAIYDACHEPGWLWFEDILSYDNALMPHALILSGYWMGNAEVLERGLTSLRWLMETQISPETGCFSPIGSNGFYRRGEQRARFDQQPLEACAMVSACLEAGRVTGDLHWEKQARLAFEWYLGRNDVGLPLYDTATGGCCDGLHVNRVNQNQGAESTMAYLHALTEMRLAEAGAALRDYEDAGSRADMPSVTA